MKKKVTGNHKSDNTNENMPKNIVQKSISTENKQEIEINETNTNYENIENRKKVLDEEKPKDYSKYPDFKQNWLDKDNISLG